MTTVAFILTQDVKHLSAWTQDRDTEESWVTGGHRPLCGGKTRGWGDIVRADSSFTSPRNVARAERLPVCKLCAKTLAQLVAMTGGE